MDPKKKKSFRKMPFYGNILENIRVKFRNIKESKENLIDRIPTQFRNLKLAPRQKFLLLLCVSGGLVYKGLKSIFLFYLNFLLFNKKAF